MSEHVHQFQAEVSQVLHLVINSLYSNKEIFLRELVSNASDALDKLRFRAISEPSLIQNGERLMVRIIPDSEAGTLTIWDNGIGMTEEELTKNLGTIAWSGSREFLEQIKKSEEQKGATPELIGQFGVGFYSAYLVANEVEVVSRAAGFDSAHRWVSTGEQNFRVESAERAEHGTSVILKLKPEHRHYLDHYELRALVARYSDYVAHPIELKLDKKSESDEEFEVINRGSALWQRPPKEVTTEQYEEFYRHLTHDFEKPLAWRHFKIEGTQLFAGLLFVPKRPPFDLFDPEKPAHGVRLHVKRVFVMDNCEELVPRWLRFVRGVVDSEDLPLNVSRETLQDSRVVRTMRKQVIHQTLDVLDEVARDHAEDYAAFFRGFGVVLKEGLHFDPEYKDRIARLLRYESSTREGLVSLDEYVNKMPPEQNAIYYATGASRAVVESSPHIEALRAKGYEVLFMTDPVDPFAVSSLPEYRNKKLVSAMTAELDLEGDTKSEGKPAENEPLFGAFKEILGSKVAQVRASKRLKDSPACLVVPDGALPPHIERMLRARQGDLPVTARILEVNAEHPLVRALGDLRAKHPESPKIRSFVELIYDQALLAEGSPIEDPARFAQRLSEVMVTAASVELSQP